MDNGGSMGLGFLLLGLFLFLCGIAWGSAIGYEIPRG
jgi:hypothetical protein